MLLCTKLNGVPLPLGAQFRTVHRHMSSAQLLRAACFIPAAPQGETTKRNYGNGFCVYEVRMPSSHLIIAIIHQLCI